ncbi:MAG: hypothetical protein EXS14_04265 [Planctomycetes bacterium]|nr:hypothetical protein [Planctomycetota bacterium]
MRRVLRRDGTTEPLLLQRLELDLEVVLCECGERDGALARELASAVLRHLELNRPPGDIAEHDLDDMFVRVLQATGHEDAAARLVETRELRDTLLSKLLIHAPGGDAPWSRQRLAASLVRRTGLPELLVTDLVASVERHLARLGIERVPSGLVTELAATGLMKLDGTTLRSAATVSLSPRRLGELCSDSGGQAALCDRAIANEVLERLMLQEIHSGAVAAAVENRLIALPGIGDPFRPAFLGLAAEDAPCTLPALARLVRILLPCVRSNLWIPGFEALLRRYGAEAVHALVEAVADARRAGAGAWVQIDLAPLRSHHDALGTHAAGLGIRVEWNLQDGIPDAEEAALLSQIVSAGDSVRLRNALTQRRSALLEVALNLPVLLEGVAGPEQADVVMSKAAGLVHTAEAERCGLVDGASVRAALHEATGLDVPLNEETHVSIWGLGAALSRLVSAGAGRSQDHPRLAARLLGHLDYAASDAAPRPRRVGFWVDSAQRRRFLEASSEHAAGAQALLPVEIPLFGSGNRELLASKLSERMLGPIPLPAALLPPQGIPAMLRQLRSRTRLESVCFPAPESGVLEVQGDLFRAQSHG